MIVIAGHEFVVEQPGDGTTSRVIRVVDSGGSPNSKVEVPIVLESQGDENALGFSLEFDTNVLAYDTTSHGQDANNAILNVNDSLASTGKIGLVLALAAGQTFITGSRELVVVSFTIDANTDADSTMIAFIDQPVVREVVDINANQLSASWQRGAVRIFRGFEGDVMPRPGGDNRVSVADCAQLGRFAAQLDIPRTDVNEFQRADCAPSTSCGNGRISVADWVQTCRYAAALDPIIPACGPTSPTTIALAGNAEIPNPATVFTNAGLRTVRAVHAIDDTFAIGRKDSLRIELDAQGDENALSFSVEFDPTVLIFDTALAGKDARGTIFIPNSTQQDSGRVGLVMALSAGQSFSSGQKEIAVLVFTVVMNTSANSTPVDFGDQPVVREIVDTNADTLSANWIPGKIVITSVVSAIGSEIATEFSLHQNYPNPFNPATTIEFSLPRSVHVKLTIFDLLGREIAALVDRSFAAGKYKVDWDASGLESGMYFYRLQAGDHFLQIKKLILMK